MSASRKNEFTVIVREAPRRILEPQPARAAAGNTFAVAQLIGVSALLFFGVLAYGAVEEWSTFVLQAGAMLLVLLWAAQGIRTGEIVFRNIALLAPASVFLLLIVVQQAAHRSSYLHATQYAAMLYVAYGCVLLVGANVAPNESLRRALALTFAGFGALYALFAIVQDLSSHGKLYWVHKPPAGWIFGSYVSHAHYAGLMEMLTPFAVVLALGRFFSGAQRALAGFAAVVMTASVFLSGSRGGMLSIAVETVFLLALVLRHSRSRRLLYAFAGLAVLVVVFLAISSRGQVLARLGDLQPDQRAATTRDGLRMAAERPLLGFGLGTFPVVYPQYRSYYTSLFVNEAHNDYVQLLVETGLVGFAVGLWFLFVLYRKGLPLTRGWNARWHSAVCLAALTGCTGLLAHSFVDFNLQIPANAAMFYFLAALASTAPDQTAGPQRQRERQ